MRSSYFTGLIDGFLLGFVVGLMCVVFIAIAQSVLKGKR